MSLPLTMERDVSFKWEIPNFRFGSYTIGQGLFSPKFGTDQEQWFIQLSPKGLNKECQGFISFGIISCGRPVADAEYRVSILDSENQKYHTGKFDAKGLNKAACTMHKCKMFIKHSEIEKNLKRILPDNTLRITCEVSFNRMLHEDYRQRGSVTSILVNSNSASIDCYSEKKIHESRGIKRSRQDAELKTTGSDKKSFRLLFDNKKFSDIKIVCTDDKCIYAHKAILATQNEVFQNMLMSDAINDQSVIEIKDISYEVLREVIRYIYTSEVNDICQFALRLLAPARKYLLNDLSLLCEKTMCENLSTTNALTYYSAAAYHVLPDLKKKAANYILSNMKDIVKVPEFQTITLSDPNIILDICKYAASQGE